MSKRYSLNELRELWDAYHTNVHPAGSGVPCDACPGDPCYTTSFFDWLKKVEVHEARIIKIVKKAPEEAWKELQ